MKKVLLRIDTSRNAVSDYAGQPYDAIAVVHGDSVLFCAAFEELPADGSNVLTAMDLSGATSLRLQVRLSRIAPAVSKTDIGLITTYNLGYWSAEDLTTGHISWLFPFTDADIATNMAGSEYLDVWCEFSWVGADAQPQTLAQFEARIYDQLDNGAAGSPPPTTPTYLTAAEIDAAYVAMADFDANTILAATADDTPVALTVAEQSLVGRITAGNIAALSAAQVRTLLAVSTSTDTVLKSLFDANTILAANTDNTPAALTVAEARLVGRATGGNIDALTAAAVLAILDVPAFTAFENPDVDTGTEALLTITDGAVAGAYYTAWVRGMRAGALHTRSMRLQAHVGIDAYAALTVATTEDGPPVHGDATTTDVVFAWEISGDDLILKATVIADNWAFAGRYARWDV